MSEASQWSEKNPNPNSKPINKPGTFRDQFGNPYRPEVIEPYGRMTNVDRRAADTKASQAKQAAWDAEFPKSGTNKAAPPPPDPVSDQTRSISAYTKQQAADIARIQEMNASSIGSQLNRITQLTNGAQLDFTNTLNNQMRESRQFNEKTVAGFTEANLVSARDVAKSQSQIATLPGVEKVAQISDTAETVSGWSDLGMIGVQRGAVNLRKTGTRTGLSAAQQSSRQRQKLGIKGLRRGSL